MLPIYRSISFCNRLHVPKERLHFDLSLYLVANRPSFQDENLFFSKIMESVKGGVSCVQLRDHKSDFSSIVRTATHLKQMLKGTPLFINTLRSFEVVLAVDADGIFLEEKFSHSEARKLLGRKIVIGIPVKTMTEVAAAAQNNEIDYLSVKVSPSKRTCPRNDALWGMEGLRSVCVIFGVAFFAPFHAWAQQLIPPTCRYAVISFGYALGSQLLGSPTAALALWCFQKTRMISSVAWYWMVLGLASSLSIAKTLKVRNKTQDYPSKANMETAST
jgi:thiamine-phosphate diphosphorylase